MTRTIQLTLNLLYQRTEAECQLISAKQGLFKVGVGRRDSPRPGWQGCPLPFHTANKGVTGYSPSGVAGVSPALPLFRSPLSLRGKGGWGIGLFPYLPAGDATARPSNDCEPHAARNLGQGTSY